MVGLRRLGIFTIALAATVAVATQGCEEDASNGGGAFDSGGPGLFEAGGQDTSTAPDTSMPGVDAAPEAAVDAALEAGFVLNDGSAPVALLRTFKSPRSLAVDGTYVYVATAEGVFRIAKDGSSIVRMTLAEDVGRLTRDGARIFFTTDTEVKVMPLTSVDGGSEVSLFAGDAGNLPVRVAAGSVYFGLYKASFGTDISVMDEDGGNPRLAATGTNPYDLAAVGTTVFAAASNKFDVRQLPNDGGAGVTRFTSNVGVLSDFVARDGYLYWSTRGGAVMRMPVAAGAAETIATGEGPVAGLAVDEANVYWVRYETFSATGVLRRAPKAGGVTPITLASAQLSAFAIAVDDTHVYWSELLNDGGVSRVPK